MTARGRRPKPTAVKELAGNPGHRPLNAREPKPPASSGRTPRGLGAEGARFYRRYGPVLAELGVLSTLDEPGLRMAAEHYEVTVRAFQELREGAVLLAPDGSGLVRPTGLLVQDDDGNLRKNPLLQVARDNSAALKAWLTEYGMTPAARSKIHVDDAEQPSLLDQLFAKVQEAGAGAEADPASEFDE